MRRLAVFTLLVGALPALAADVFLRCGSVVDVVQGRVLQRHTVVLREGRIVAVGPESSMDKPRAQDQVIDWSAYTVAPGLIDLHTHLVGDITSASATVPLASSQARDALIGVANAGTTLRAGFTSVRDVGAYRGFTDVALRDAIENGIVEGPRMFVVGAYVTVSGGGGEVTGVAPDVLVPAEMRRGVADDAASIRRTVRQLIAGGADWIKIIATGAVLTAGTEPGAPEYSEAEIRAAVEEARAHGVFVTAHAHGAEGIHRAVRAGVRSIEHASYLDAEGIALMKQHGTWLVADIYNGDYIDEIGSRDGWPEDILRKNRETTGAQRDGFSAAVRAGVRIAFGTDAGVYPHGDNARQFAYMVRYGQTPLQALQSATIEAARLLDRESSLGSIDAGKHADLIALRCDPLKNVDCLRQVAGVIKAGRMVDAAR